MKDCAVGSQLIHYKQLPKDVLVKYAKFFS